MIDESLRQATLKAVENRRVIEGETSDLMMIRPVRHEWARDLLNKMLENTWTHTEIDLSADSKMYRTGQLNSHEERMFKKALAFVSNLDGIQLNNLTNNVNRYVTSPEINQCLVRQAWEEALHVESYATIIESIGFDPIEIYWMFERDKVLAEKNALILEQTRLLGNEYSPQNFIRAVAANIALEGVYFYAGFLVFYAFLRARKMMQSAQMIKLIHKDERTHLMLFINIWRTLQRERPADFTEEVLRDCRQIIINAGELEGAWGRHLIDGGGLGLTDQVMTAFPRWRVDQTLAHIGQYPAHNTKNPAPWFEELSSVAGSLENFFESKKTTYTTGLNW